MLSSLPHLCHRISLASPSHRPPSSSRLSQWRNEREEDDHSQAVSLKIVEYRKRAQALTLHHGLPEMTQVRGAAVFSVAYYGAVNCKDFLPIPSRTEILNFVDEAKQQGLIPWRLRKEGLFTVSVYGIKVTDLAGRDPPFMREDLHSIASVCGADEEDNNFTLLIKTGSPEETVFRCHILDVHADSSTEILSLIQHTVAEAFKHAHPLAPAPPSAPPSAVQSPTRPSLTTLTTPKLPLPPLSPPVLPRYSTTRDEGEQIQLVPPTTAPQLSPPPRLSANEVFVADEQVVVQLR